MSGVRVPPRPPAVRGRSARSPAAPGGPERRVRPHGAGALTARGSPAKVSASTGAAVSGSKRPSMMKVIGADLGHSGQPGDLGGAGCAGLLLEPEVETVRVGVLEAVGCRRRACHAGDQREHQGPHDRDQRPRGDGGAAPLPQVASHPVARGAHVDQSTTGGTGRQGWTHHPRHGARLSARRRRAARSRPPARWSPRWPRDGTAGAPRRWGRG